MDIITLDQMDYQKILGKISLNIDEVYGGKVCACACACAPSRSSNFEFISSTAGKSFLTRVLNSSQNVEFATLSNIVELNSIDE